MSDAKGISNKEKIARRVALEFNDGDLVNLGAGLPTLAVQYLDKSKTIYLHAENGILGFGPDDPSLPRDPFRTDAGENPVTINAGGAIIDSPTSFGIIRGGHLSITVLGTFQVDGHGNIANWTVPGGKLVGMGGAMDLVCGAKRVIVATEHCDKAGAPKIVETCTFPLTGSGVVDMIVTELAVFEVTPQGLFLTEKAADVTVDELREKTGAPFTVSPELQEMGGRI